MDKKNKKSKKDNKVCFKMKATESSFDSTFKTLAIADSEAKDKETNTSIASDEAVEAAKEWVDENKL